MSIIGGRGGGLEIEKNDHFSITKFKVTLENIISIIYQIFRRRVNAKKSGCAHESTGLILQ